MKIFFTCVLSIFIVSVFCEGVIPQGEGTIESPFLIETLDNLRYISENSNMWLDFYYLQTADIDASSSINWNSGAGFKPLGEAFQVINFDENGDIYYDDCLTPFDSYYDGGGFSISGLYITSDGSNSDFIAFVSNQTYGTLDNINLIDVNVSGFKYVGGLVAYTESTINNCSVSGNVNAVGSFAGGLAAVCDGGMIANSSFSGSVHASSDASLLVVQCSSDINNCDVSGTLTADSKASGLVCYRSDSAEISDCSVDIYMNIIPTDVNYGIFDFNHNSKYLHKENYTNIKNTFYNSNSRINNEEQNLFGKLTNAEFQEWLANDKVFDPDNYFQSSSNSYLISSEEEFKNLKYFYSRNDLNFMLNSDITFGTETSSVIPLFNGHLDGNNHTLSDLALNASQNNTGLFGLLESESIIENITLDNFTIEGVDMVGALAGVTKGEISNCNVNGSIEAEDACGLIVGLYLEGANINNCTTTGEIQGTNYLGGIAGRAFLPQNPILSCNSTANISGNLSIGGIIGYLGQASYCTFDGHVIGQNNVGGILGSSGQGCCAVCESHGIIEGVGFVGGIAGVGEVYNSMSDALVIGNEKVGGLVGESWKATSSYFLGEVRGESYVGGIVGHFECDYPIALDKCFSNGIVKGLVNVGGIAGYLNDSIIEDCFSRSSLMPNEDFQVDCQNFGGLVGKASTANINNCYTTSVIDVTGLNVGGLTGEIDEETITQNSFWSSELAGQESSASGINVTPSQLQTQATFTDVGWDFGSIWYLFPDQNDGYPVLRNVYYTANADDEDDEFMQDIESVTSLKSAYPNPFNPETTIEFYVDKGDIASLTIYNVKGQVVKKFDSYLPGEHKVIWNGRNRDNKQVSSGLYLYTLTSKNTNMTKKMVLLK